MEDVLALYERPPSETEPVVCVDEKPVVLHADVRRARPMRPGRILRRDSEYKRCAAANVFCGIEPKAGRHFTKATPPRSSPEFADYLLEIAASYPQADTIHLVMDNLSSHRRKAIVERFGEKIGGWLWDRFTVHYTPKHGSWLDQAEIEISLFSRQCLGPTQNPFPPRPSKGSQGLEPQDEPQPRHHRLGVHAHKSTPEVRLQKTHHYAVRDRGQIALGVLLLSMMRSSTTDRYS
jgi:hypothetical protein